ncbi:SCUB1-like protein, partial [Mya arenaria]
INECSLNKGGCQHVCRNNVGSFTCSCNSGYVLKTDLKTCEVKSECYSNNGGCAHTCINRPGSHQCSCRDGYTLASDGRQCNDIDECSLPPFPCDHQCRNTPGSYTCSCEPGYYLDTGSQTCKDVNECDTNSDSCDHFCTNTEGTYQCSCRQGYVRNTDGSTCIDTIGRFLRIEAGGGIGFAISLDTNGKCVALLRVEAKFLGLEAETDMLITNQGLYMYEEGNVWNTFKAQLQISAELQDDWYKLSYDVKGRFVAGADGEGFNDGYLAALRRFTSTIADGAKEKNNVTKAQRQLTAAEGWLQDKKSIFRNANSKFDDAVGFLDRAKDKLEDAQKTFQDTFRPRFYFCHTCIFGVRFPYPCCKVTTCMISFPDPICLRLNLLCRAARGIAYLALKAAKVFIRKPMLAFDTAKAAVSAAQFTVDKSMVVLDIAVDALDLAEQGLEATKGTLEGAKLALESVKQVVKLGVAALNFIIEYGLESIIDVQNCGFEVTLSLNDKANFDVQCEVNAFKTGFKTIKLRINFNDIFQSLWYAAKATITAILNSIGNIFGRNRREIEYDTLNLFYKHYRKTRDTHVNDSETLTNETIDIIANTFGFTNNKRTVNMISGQKYFYKTVLNLRIFLVFCWTQLMLCTT